MGAETNDLNPEIAKTGFNSGVTPSHVQRMIDEREQLADRHDKLATFFGSSIYAALPEVDQKLLCHQYEAMSTYLDVLNKRVDRAQA